jgi:hypothetical protein
MPAPKSLPGFAAWASLATLVMVIHIARVGEIEKGEASYYLSSRRRSPHPQWATNYVSAESLCVRLPACPNSCRSPSPRSEPVRQFRLPCASSSRGFSDIGRRERADTYRRRA